MMGRIVLAGTVAALAVAVNELLVVHPVAVNPFSCERVQWRKSRA